MSATAVLVWPAGNARLISAADLGSSRPPLDPTGPLNEDSIGRGVGGHDSTRDISDHNWGQRGAMEVHALVKKSGGVGSGVTRVGRLRYFTAVLPRSQRPVASTVSILIVLDIA